MSAGWRFLFHCNLEWILNMALLGGNCVGKLYRVNFQCVHISAFIFEVNFGFFAQLCGSFQENSNLKERKITFTLFLDCFRLVPDCSRPQLGAALLFHGVPTD